MKKDIVSELKYARYIEVEICTMESELFRLNNREIIFMLHQDEDYLKAYQKATQKKLRELYRVKNRICNYIEKVPDLTQRLLLELRYISGWGWEEISRELNYSLRNLHYMHKKALKAVKEVEANEKNKNRD